MNQDIQWPLFTFSPLSSNKFWSSPNATSSKLLLEQNLIRIGLKKHHPKSYWFRLYQDGTFSYFKNEKDRTPKATLKLNFNIFVSLEQHHISSTYCTVALRISRSQTVSILLYNQEDAVSKLYEKITLFCCVKGYDTTYTKISDLGQGGFAVVEKVHQNHTLKERAAKVYTQLRFEKSNSKRRFKQMIENEIRVMRDIQHENIMELYEVFQEEDRLIMICELIDGEDLYEYLKKKQRLKENRAAMIVYNIASALQMLHNNEYVHRDIKIENVMYNGNSVKLIDFGFAEKVNYEKLSNKSGTPGYIAPEVFASQPYTGKGDIFSLGVILYTLVSGYSAFVGENVKEISRDNKKCIINMNKQVFKKISMQCKSLICFMMKRSPEQRFSAEQVLSSSWMKRFFFKQQQQEDEEGVVVQQLNNSPVSSGSYIHEFSYDVRSFYQQRDSKNTYKTQRSSKSNKSSNSIFGMQQQRLKYRTFQGRTDSFGRRQSTIDSLQILNDDDDPIHMKNLIFLQFSCCLFNKKKKR